MIVLSDTVGNWLGRVDQGPCHLKQAPRGRGRPCVYATSVIIRCYLLMLLQPQLRQHARLHAFLVQHACVRRLVGLEQVPHRTTFSRRFSALEHELQARIWATGLAFVLSGTVQAHVLIADGTLHNAAGPSWPAKLQKQGVLPAHLRHVDQAAGWGKSPYRQWVWGYRTHPILGLTAAGQPVPLLADVRPADVAENRILARQLGWLPEEATVLLLDSSYEDEALIQQWQRQEADGTLTHWVVLQPKRRPGQPAAWRQWQEVARYVNEADLYKLRGSRVEPFFAHWKEAFALQHLALQGQQARVFLLLAMYGYQLLLDDNLKAGRPLYAYRHLIIGEGDG